jgi:hypothetical protein
MQLLDTLGVSLKSFLYLIIDTALTAWFIYYAWDQIVFGLTLIAVMFILVGPGFTSISYDRRAVWYNFIDKKILPFLRVYMAISSAILLYLLNVDIATLSVENDLSGTSGAILAWFYALALAVLVFSYIIKIIVYLTKP